MFPPDPGTVKPELAERTFAQIGFAAPAHRFHC